MKKSIAILLVLASQVIFAQYPKDYFRSPLDIPINLSGTFGELRPNHFHSGLDIRTNNVEGLPVYAAADGIIISMTDKNPAIPALELERIFERFYRLDSVRTAQKIGGSGIGLSIVKQILSRHKGKVWAENKNGSTYFCLQLPIPK